MIVPPKEARGSQTTGTDRHPEDIRVRTKGDRLMFVFHERLSNPRSG
jgi:hypothetical protein